MGPNVFECVRMGPNMFEWVQIYSNGSECVRMGSNGFECVRMEGFPRLSVPFPRENDFPRRRKELSSDEDASSDFC